MPTLEPVNKDALERKQGFSSSSSAAIVRRRSATLRKQSYVNEILGFRGDQLKITNFPWLLQRFSTKSVTYRFVNVAAVDL